MDPKIILLMAALMAVSFIGGRMSLKPEGEFLNSAKLMTDE